MIISNESSIKIYKITLTSSCVNYFEYIQLPLSGIKYKLLIQIFAFKMCVSWFEDYDILNVKYHFLKKLDWVTFHIYFLIYLFVFLIWSITCFTYKMSHIYTDKYTSLRTKIRLFFSTQMNCFIIFQKKCIGELTY